MRFVIGKSQKISKYSYVIQKNHKKNEVFKMPIQMNQKTTNVNIK